MATCGSSVLLGVCDAPCEGPELSPYENKIGGYPDFFPSSLLPALPRCSLCGGCLQLLVQIYCPLEGSDNHRLMHLYCCPQTPCNKRNEGWLALRSEMKDSALSSSTKTTPGTTVCRSRPLETDTQLAPSGWCNGADDWGEGEGESKDDFENELATLTQAVDKVAVTTPTKQHTSLTGPYFKPTYMNVVEEPATLEHTDLQQRAEELLQKYKTESGENSEDMFSSGSATRPGYGSVCKKGPGSGGSEKYERCVPKHGDRAFQKFKKKLSFCPNQVLRYCWKGKPLLISDSNQPPKASQVTCKTCGSRSAFEFQLMPPLAYFLRQSGDKRGTGAEAGGRVSLEFGTVEVYSCLESCWNDRDGELREEYVSVVADPDSEIITKVTHALN